MSDQEFTTTRELAAKFRLAPQTISRRARQLGIGFDPGGRAERRFTAADVEAFIASMRPTAEPLRRRRPRRSARSG